MTRSANRSNHAAEAGESRSRQQEVALNDRYRLDNSQTLYRGRVIDLTVDRITTASGTQAVREVVVHPGGAAVVPVFSNGDVLLVEQFRYPMQQSLLELPAGKIDPGESPEETAARELEEEVGFKAGRLEKLAAFYTTPGFCNELLHLFLAGDLEPGRRSGDEDEELSVHRYSPKQLEQLIRQGKIVDAKTLIGLHHLLAIEKDHKLNIDAKDAQDNQQG